MRRPLFNLMLASIVLAAACAPALAEDKDHHKDHPVKYQVEFKGKGKPEPLDMKIADHQKRLAAALEAGDVNALHLDHPPNPMELVWDLGLWALVIFVLLLIILRKAAWGPMLEGLQKREETILSSV